MRRALVGALLLVTSLASLPAAHAQTGQPGDVRFEDPAGDVQIRNQNQTVTGTTGTHAHLDIRSAWFGRETDMTFTVGARVAQWADPAEGQPSDLYKRQFTFVFSFAGLTYGIVNHQMLTNPTIPATCPSHQALLGSASNEFFFQPLACLNATSNASAATWEVEVPKSLIKSAKQVPIQQGETITRIAVLTRQFLAPGAFAVDRAPDTNHADPFLLKAGSGERRGDLFLVPTVPLRASNGEATTMVFPVQLTNRGDRDDSVVITTETSVESWKIRAPQRVRAPAGATVMFPVILSMEFSHDHGVTRYFTVKGESTVALGDFASIPLGVHWLEIPQPAGHHDRLWLHSAPADWDYGGFVSLPGTVMGSRSAWINAIETDPRNGVTDDNVPGSTRSVGIVVPYVGSPMYVGQTTWFLRLSPELQIGLDLDHTRDGTFETRIRSTLPSTTASLTGTVEYFCCGTTATRTVLFSGKADGPGLPLNGELPFRMDLKPNASADVVPYAPGSDIVLWVVLQHQTPQTLHMHNQPPTPQLVVRNSIITLPLNEYHDPVDQAFENIGALALRPLDPVEKQVNPGRGAAFRFDITNDDDVEHRLRVLAEGVNAEWSTIVGDATFALQPGERRQSTLIVRAPDDAQPGERAELFFVAEGVDDPSLVALSRVRASVVDPTVAEMTDEAGILDNNQSSDTPAPGLAIALFATLAAAAIRGRRR